MTKYIVITLLALFFTCTKTNAYQNSYQNMWFDGVCRKDCKFNTKLQMCESESENFRNLKEYNDYHNGINGYYCKNGYLYQAMGFNQQLILQTTDYGRPMGCTLDNVYPYTKSPWYLKKQTKMLKQKK